MRRNYDRFCILAGLVRRGCDRFRNFFLCVGRFASLWSCQTDYLKCNKGKFGSWRIVD